MHAPTKNIYVDRIEGKTAILSDSSGSVFELPAELLPPGAAEGSVLLLIKDDEEEQRRRKALYKKAESLFE